MIASTQTNHPIAHIGGSTDATDSIDAVCQRLKDAGLRITQPRIAILNSLINYRKPVSIEQIHQDLDRSACDLVTVYRCLAAFEEIGIVKRSFFHNGTSLYQLIRQGDTAYHVVCKDTGSVEALDPEIAAEIGEILQKAEEILEARGYTDVGHLLEFFARAPLPAHDRVKASIKISSLI